MPWRWSSCPSHRCGSRDLLCWHRRWISGWMKEKQRKYLELCEVAIKKHHLNKPDFDWQLSKCDVIRFPVRVFFLNHTFGFSSSLIISCTSRINWTWVDQVHLILDQFNHIHLIFDHGKGEEPEGHNYAMSSQGAGSETWSSYRSICSLCSKLQFKYMFSKEIIFSLKLTEFRLNPRSAMTTIGGNRWLFPRWKLSGISSFL